MLGVIFDITWYPLKFTENDDVVEIVIWGI